jgi:hypothetical protein
VKISPSKSRDQRCGGDPVRMSLVLMRLSETPWKHGSHLEDWKTHTRAFDLSTSHPIAGEKESNHFLPSQSRHVSHDSSCLTPHLEKSLAIRDPRISYKLTASKTPAILFLPRSLHSRQRSLQLFERDIDPCCAPEHLHCISAERLCTEGTCPIIRGTGHSSKRWRGTGGLACFMRLTIVRCLKRGEAERIIWLCDNNCDSETEEL